MIKDIQNRLKKIKVDYLKKVLHQSNVKNLDTKKNEKKVVSKNNVD